MGIRQYRFDTSLDAVLKLENPSIMDGQTALDGTYFRLYDARFKKEGQRAPDAWYAAFEITEGRLGLLGDDVKRGSDNVIDLFQLFGRYEARELLADSSGAVTFESEVSSLAWIGVLFRDNYQASVSGSGRLGGVVTLDAGLPAPGTEVAVSSDALQVHILDFVATGDGGVDLAVEEGGDQPDWKVAVALRDAGMRRRDDEEASIHDVDLELEAVVENVSFEREPGAFALQFRIPSGLVSDMAVFNGFLPPDSPVRFAGGQANLTADIELQQDDADGWLRLRSDGVKALADAAREAGLEF